MRRRSKTRQGFRVKRTRDHAATPCQRLVASGILTSTERARLRARYRSLNPAQLRREIARHQDELLELTRRKPRRATTTAKVVTPRPDHPWPRTFLRATAHEPFARILT